VVTGPVFDTGRVAGVVVKARDGVCRTHRSTLVIAADGRESRLARALGLARHPVRPRRWAIGGYFEGAESLSAKGEMHVRAGHYIGVAPLPGGLANACLVVPHHAPHANWKEPAAMLVGALRRDLRLRDRFATARLLEPPHVLGPLAVDACAPGAAGMLLAGDAAGFIDPMTGDGLRLALEGACISAAVAVEVLNGGIHPEHAVAVLTARRRAAFAAKWRFNRTIRALVARAPAIEVAALAAQAWPRAFAQLIQYAGDCPVADEGRQRYDEHPADERHDGRRETASVTAIPGADGDGRGYQGALRR
jgi:flavin-dependent dehydrogenase